MLVAGLITHQCRFRELKFLPFLSEPSSVRCFGNMCHRKISPNNVMDQNPTSGHLSGPASDAASPFNSRSVARSIR
jgi:hypothetical protein